jgi:cation transport ATPase
MQAARLINTLLLGVAGLGLMGGAAAWFAGAPDQADWIWAGATVPVLVVVLTDMIRALLRGDVGVDLIAVLSMTAALLLGEELAGVVIALMISGGGALEDFAQNRARRELTRLLARAPASANRYRDGEIVHVPLADVRRGDRLLVRAGEIVPVDGVVTAGIAVLDEAALTGEALPVRRPSGDRVRSGTVNAGDPFDLVATASAEESTYAGIVRLVQAAQAQKAPFVRLADRYALLFVPLTLLVAGVAWLASGDPVRALAVLVVATPCPLILAAPVAIVAGISRAAGQGILVKGGGALETLARGRVLLFDKTGTLTTGQARLGASETDGSVTAEEMLRLAASLRSGLAACDRRGAGHGGPRAGSAPGCADRHAGGARLGNRGRGRGAARVGWQLRLDPRASCIGVLGQPGASAHGLRGRRERLRRDRRGNARRTPAE